MNGTSTLPILTNAPNRLAEGINAQPAGSVQQPVHPVEAIERQFARQADANQKNLLARVYGSHLPMKLHMEQVRRAGRSGGERGGKKAPHRFAHSPFEPVCLLFSALRSPSAFLFCVSVLFAVSRRFCLSFVVRAVCPLLTWVCRSC